tara:strand:- start:260 stop:1618 length:1359 start_codon:yes stop_codon:yes gene_type:complete
MCQNNKLTICGLFAILVFLSIETEAREPYDSTYQPRVTNDLLIKNATILDGKGAKLLRTDVSISAGKITKVEEGIVDDHANIIDADGKWLTPGIIDVHSHLGVYPSPSISATSDGNESTSPNTARVWAEHSVWPQDPQFGFALAGGVTTLQILPGSANLFGGRGVTLKNVPSRTVQGMKFPGAPHSLKMACGENPKRVYGGKNKSPATRMGNAAGYRAAWIKAKEYQEKLNNSELKLEDKPDRDLTMETLVGVLNGEILVHNHCYRADEMANMIEIAREFDYKITAFHHAVESYKIADLLAEQGICSAMWVDWWGFKLEAFDAIQQNIGLVDKAGACAIVHSDSSRDIQRLNQEAAKAMSAMLRMGEAVTPEKAITWITSNPAKALGIADKTGSIEIGRAADLVLWDSNPFSVYTRAELVLIDGYLYFDRNDPSKQPITDFSLGQTHRKLSK